jgi:hypothetical protein
MNIFLVYWLPLLMTIIYDIIVSYCSGAKTVGELFTYFSILAFIPLINILTTFCGTLVIVGIICHYIGNIGIKNKGNDIPVG